MNIKKIVSIGIGLAIIIFFIWRFTRPLSIFVVTDNFALPVDTSKVPDMLSTLSAEQCGNCHTDFYNEWKTTIHSQAWTEPYFQVDWKFDDSQQVCRNCHTPLDRQQPHLVTGFNDADRLDPILVDNPDFDAELQHQGVNCSGCHLREGKILGVFGDTNAPHPVTKIDNPNEICVRCHIVGGDRWDTFFKLPPCGTVAEISKTVKPADKVVSHSGEVVLDKGELGCVYCHMPAVERPLVKGGKARMTRQHLWRGGHDPDMVKSALTASFAENATVAENKRSFTLTVTNTGAAHYLPTGTPDRHLSVIFKLFDAQGAVLKEETHLLKRSTMFRPFIIDLDDTRLPRWQPRKYQFDFLISNKPATVEAVVKYHLLEESRRQRIGYENSEPISYEIFKQSLELNSKLN